MGYLLMLAAAQPKEVIEAGTAAADTLTRTVLGSLVVLLMIIVGLIGWLLVKAKNEHLTDKDVMRKEMLAQALKSQELAEATNRSNDALMRESEGLAAEVSNNNDRLQRLETTNGERLQRFESAMMDRCAKVEATVGERIQKLETSVGEIAANSKGSCRGAEDAAANVDALAMATPGVDRDKYFLAKRTKGGGP